LRSVDVYRELIEQVRESRRRMSEACEHDLSRYITYLRSFNIKYAEQVARFESLRSHKHPATPLTSSE